MTLVWNDPTEDLPLGKKQLATDKNIMPFDLKSICLIFRMCFVARIALC